MKKISFKSLDSLGIAKMSSKDLKNVTGGNFSVCQNGADCPMGEMCINGYCTGENGCDFVCDAKCPCKRAEDWCVNNRCQRRPR